MSKQNQLPQCMEYIESEGLHELLDFEENIDVTRGVFDAVSGQQTTAIPPEPGDLIRLHMEVRRRRCFTVLEFGVGYSTIVIADALQKNHVDWNSLARRPEVRKRHLFQLFTVDTSQDWIERTKTRFPRELIDRVHFHHSDAEIGTYNGQLCHYYKQLPDIVPDFVYLDGPSPKDVKGSINGLSFQCEERTVMSADLLLMESTFLPGICILVDGRTNNARFLERHFSRDYEVVWDKEGDVTMFELIEERLGRYNVQGSDFA